MKLPPVLLGLALLTLVAGCHTPPGKPAMRTGSLPRERHPGGQYEIQPGDLLTITFASEPDYNQQVRVDWNGKIALPWLSAAGGPTEISAGGLSPAELAAKVSKFASDSTVLLNPRAQVFVTDYANQTFVVLGQVTTPGRYSFPKGVPPRLDLEEAIGFGGGYTRLARQSKVLVKRGGRVNRIDLRRMTSEPGAERFVVLPGDVITVTERIF